MRCAAKLLELNGAISRNRPLGLNVPSSADPRARRDVMALRRRRRNSRNGHDVQARLNALRADLDALQEDMRGLVTEVGGAASEQVQGAMSGVISTAQDAVD